MAGTTTKKSSKALRKKPSSKTPFKNLKPSSKLSKTEAEDAETGELDDAEMDDAETSEDSETSDEAPKASKSSKPTKAAKSAKKGADTDEKTNAGNIVAEASTFMALFNTIVALQAYSDALTLLTEHPEFVSPSALDVRLAAFLLFVQLGCIKTLEGFKVATGFINNDGSDINTFDTVESFLADECLRPTKIMDLYNGDDDVFLVNSITKEIYLIGNTKIVSKSGKKSSRSAKNNRVKYNRTHAKLSVATIDDWGKKARRFSDAVADRGFALSVLFYVHDCNTMNDRVANAFVRNNFLVVSDADIISRKSDNSGHAVFLERFGDMDSQKALKESACDNLANESPVIYRIHQIYTIMATTNAIQKWENDDIHQENQEALNIVWGHVARSGKTFMMRCLIDQLLLNDSSNLRALIITTVPQETIHQYISIMRGLMASRKVDFVTDKAEIDAYSESTRAVFIFSKQLLTHQANRDLFIENINLLMVDEAHYGGMTDLGLKMIDAYGAIPRVFITATFSPVIATIEHDLTVNWDLEDMVLLRADDFVRLEEKHPGIQEAANAAMVYYSENGISQEAYVHSNRLPYPKLNVIGYELEDGVDAKIAFKTSNGKFVNEGYVEAALETILTETIPAFESWHESIGQRPIYSKDSPSVIMCFIPSSQIEDLSDEITDIVGAMSRAIKICPCNTVGENGGSANVADKINDALVEAKDEECEAVLVITGRQAHLGITIERCDVAIMFNVSKSFEYMFQAMFRCMSEAEHKVTGYVIDVDIKRSLAFMKAYSEMCANANKSTDYKADTSDAITAMISSHAIGWCAHNDLDNLYNAEAMTETVTERCEALEAEIKLLNATKALESMTVTNEEAQ